MVGIRALKQNASEVMARVKKGASIVVTDRGRPVGRIVPVAQSLLERLEQAGELTPPTGSLDAVLQAAAIHPEPLVSSSELLERSREERL